MYYTSKEMYREMHEKRLASVANAHQTSKAKKFMKKFGIYTLRTAWVAVVFVATVWTMFITSMLLSDAIPSDTNAWVRMAIGVPCIIVAPVCVELLLIAISRRLDRHHLLGIH